MKKIMSNGRIPDTGKVVLQIGEFHLYQIRGEFGQPGWVGLKLVRLMENDRRVKANWPIAWNGERFASSVAMPKLLKSHPKIYKEVVEFILAQNTP